MLINDTSAALCAEKEEKVSSNNMNIQLVDVDYSSTNENRMLVNNKKEKKAGLFIAKVLLRLYVCILIICQCSYLLFISKLPKFLSNSPNAALILSFSFILVILLAFIILKNPTIMENNRNAILCLLLYVFLGIIIILTICSFNVNKGIVGVQAGAVAVGGLYLGLIIKKFVFYLPFMILCSIIDIILFYFVNVIISHFCYQQDAYVGIAFRDDLWFLIFGFLFISAIVFDINTLNNYLMKSSEPDFTKVNLNVIYLLIKTLSIFVRFFASGMEDNLKEEMKQILGNIQDSMKEMIQGEVKKQVEEQVLNIKDNVEIELSGCLIKNANYK